MQVLAEDARGHFVHFKQSVAKLRVAAAEFVLLRNGDAVTLGDHLQRVEEPDVLDLHNELKDVAAGAAAETLVKLMSAMDGKRRRFFVVKRAEADVARTGARLLQRKVLANRLDDVHRRFYLFDEVHLAIRCPRNSPTMLTRGEGRAPNNKSLLKCLSGERGRKTRRVQKLHRAQARPCALSRTSAASATALRRTDFARSHHFAQWLLPKADGAGERGDPGALKAQRTLFSVLRDSQMKAAARNKSDGRDSR